MGRQKEHLALFDAFLRIKLGEENLEREEKSVIEFNVKNSEQQILRARRNKL